MSLLTEANAGFLTSLKRHAVILFGAAGLIGLLSAPSTAQAGGSVHLNLPGLSIGVHDDHHYKKKRYRRHYRDRYYYDDHWRKKRYYKKRHYKKRYYNRDYYGSRYDRRRYYNDDYYYGGRSSRYDRRRNYCPDPGYSSYDNDNLDCYRHKGHYHCS